MGKTVKALIHPLDDNYRGQASLLLREAWGDSIIVTRGKIHDAAQLPGFVAISNQRLVGLATYRIRTQACELISLNSQRSGLGIGTALLSAVKDMANEAGCRRLWLITTNDNSAALRFFQRRGFVLAAIHRNALDYSRRVKPQIPLVGENGIPLRDEIELEMRLTHDQQPEIIGLHHAMITIPTSAELEGRHFYCSILGLPEIEKPDSLQDRGGFWLRVGDRSLHVGVEDEFIHQTLRAHLAYEVSDLSAWRRHLKSKGIAMKESLPIAGFERFEIRDPFGNRIEFIQRFLN